jgi:hypothetical protein
MIMNKFLSALLVLTFSTQLSFGQLKTQSVSVFKNNKSFFIKSGSVSTQNNKYTLTGEMPAALNGTFWFSSPDNTIKAVISTTSITEKKQVASTTYEILKANSNSVVSLTLSDGKTVEGNIKGFSNDFDSTNQICVVPNFVEIWSAENGITTAVPLSDIKRMAFSRAMKNIVNTCEKQKAIEITFTENKATQTLNTMYLESGLGWNPNYLLELTGENKGILTLQAQVKNDAEAINGADVSFVAGVANFKDTDLPAWLVDFSSNPSVDNNGGNTIYSNATYKFSVAETADENASGEDRDVSGEASEDLFFYTLKNIILPKGSRAQYELLKTDVSLEHIYEARINNLGIWAVENNVQSNVMSEEKGIKTYHAIKLNNNSKFPWTSGLCFVVNKEKSSPKPISQDVLAYTPIKGEVLLRINENPDIKVEHSEKEVDRNNSYRKAKDAVFDQVTIEAEIKIKNYKDKAVSLQLSRMVIGELLKSSVSWKTSEKINYDGFINKMNEVKWETKLGAGQELIIKYSYKLIVRVN